MAQVILYSPITSGLKPGEDADVYDAYATLRNKFHSSHRLAMNDGKAGLAELDQPGGVMYVIGHGNAGGKIGVHGHEAVGARSLVTQLLAEGMPKVPKNEVVIHLMACCSATSVRTKYHFWRKDPYAERFCAALVAAGCSNFRVVGYVGFMSGRMQYSLDYDVGNSKKRNWQGALDSAADPLTVTYRVEKSDFNRLDGDKWLQYIDTKHHFLAKATTRLVVRKSA